MDGEGGKSSFKKMCAMLKVLKRNFHPNYYLATKLKFKIAMVGLEELQGEEEIDEKMRLCGEIQGAHVTQKCCTNFTFLEEVRRVLATLSLPH